jgi:hypothetical protein
MKATRKLRTACGGFILIPPKVEDHLKAHPEVNKILPEAIGRIKLPSTGFLSKEVELGRVIGKKTRVVTPLCDVDSKILFTQRIDRDKPSRVAPIGSVCEDTTKIVVLARPSDPRTYILVSSWIGLLARKEPWDKTIANQEEFQECLEFWCSNALIHDTAVMGNIFESTWRDVLGEKLNQQGTWVGNPL